MNPNLISTIPDLVDLFDQVKAINMGVKLYEGFYGVDEDFSKRRDQIQVQFVAGNDLLAKKLIKRLCKDMVEEIKNK